MSYNKEFILYLKDTMNFIKTFILKSEHTANSLNVWVETQGFTIQYDNKKTWYYYLNLNGEKHEANSTIFISSLDTLSDIEFTRANLLKHHNTLKEYQLLGDTYNDLIEKYPYDEIYIRGVINPVDIDNALVSCDGTILYYDSSYVNWNEVSLISDTQTFIYRYFDNWYNKGYHYTDEWYEGCVFATLAFNLIAFMHRYRLNNIGTSEVHEFHLWGKLGSHYYLDEFKDYIPKKTAHWLYRNIDWIRSNIGKNEVLYSLIKNVLQTNGLSVAKLVLQQNESTIIDDLINKPVIKRETIIDEDNTTSTNAEINIEYVLDKTRFLAEHNSTNYQYDVTTVNDLSKFAANSVDITKTLEITYAKTNNFNPERYLADIIQYWAHSIYTGKYTNDCVIKNNTGEYVKVTQEQAFITWFYIASRLYVRQMYHVPYMLFYDVPRQYIRQFDYYRNNTHPVYVDDGEITEALKFAEPTSSIDNVDEFAERVRNYAFNKYFHFLIHARAQSAEGKTALRNLVNLFYIDINYKNDYTGMDYITFFEKIGLQVHKYSDDYLEQLYTDIFYTCTGIDITSLESSNVWQEKLVEVFSRMMDYNVQIITRTDVSNSGGVNAGNKLSPLRLKIPTGMTEYDLFVPSRPLKVLKITGTITTQILVKDQQVRFAINKSTVMYHYRKDSGLHFYQIGGAIKSVSIVNRIPRISSRSTASTTARYRVRMGKSVSRVSHV